MYLYVGTPDLYKGYSSWALLAQKRGLWLSKEPEEHGLFLKRPFLFNPSTLLPALPACSFDPRAPRRRLTVDGT